MVLLLGLCGETSERMIDARSEKVSGENVVCEIEKLGRVMSVCIFSFFLFFSVCFTLFLFSLTGDADTKADLRKTSSS